MRALVFGVIARRRFDGTTVAGSMGMTRSLRPAILSMRCPHCGLSDVAAAPDRSGVIAWFTCPRCGHDWSARLRNGRPVAETVIEVLVPQPTRA